MENFHLNYERFAFPAGFLDAFRQKWWPRELHIPGIPSFPPADPGKRNMKFLTIPDDFCLTVKIPVIVKSSVGKEELRALVREIFQYQKKDEMKLYFIFGKGAENSLKDEISKNGDIIVGDFPDSYGSKNTK